MKKEEIIMFERKSAECFMIYESVPAVDKLISCFSNYYKLKRAVVWFSKFKHCLRFCSFGSKPAESSVTVSSLREAELDLIRYEQVQSFGEFLKRTPEGEQTITCSSKLTIGKLNPILVNGILRVGGRLEKAPILYDARHPIILPCVSHLTDLIIAHYHALAGHGGAIKDCMLCRRLNAKTENQ